MSMIVRLAELTLFFQNNQVAVSIVCCRLQRINYVVLVRVTNFEMTSALQYNGTHPFESFMKDVVIRRLHAEATGSNCYDNGEDRKALHEWRSENRQMKQQCGRDFTPSRVPCFVVFGLGEALFSSWSHCGSSHKALVSSHPKLNLWNDSRS